MGCDYVLNLFKEFLRCKDYMVPNGRVRFKLKQLCIINDKPNNGAYSINFVLIEAIDLLVLIMYLEHIEVANCSGGRVNETTCSIKGGQILN